MNYHYHIQQLELWQSDQLEICLLSLIGLVVTSDPLSSKFVQIMKLKIHTCFMMMNYHHHPNRCRPGLVPCDYAGGEEVRKADLRVR